jgi:hypothetical protein
VDVHDALADSACALKPFRWQEDCSNLRDRQASLRGLERLRQQIKDIAAGH